MNRYEILYTMGLGCRYQYCELVQSTPKQYSPFFDKFVNILVYRQWDTYKKLPSKNNMHLILVFVDGRCEKTYETNRPLHTLDGLNSLLFNKEI